MAGQTKWREFHIGQYRLGQVRGRACVRWTEDGKTRRVRLRATSELVARTEFKEWVKEREAGSETIAELFLAYVADREKDGKVTSVMREHGKVLLPFFGNLTPRQIEFDMGRDYTAMRHATGVKQGTIWGELVRLRACLRWAWKRGTIPNAPFIWIPSKPPAKQIALTREEAARLVGACTEHHTKLFVILGLATGGRPTALLELTWDRVDFDAGTIDLRTPRVVEPLSKAFRKGRAKVPMNADVKAALWDAYQVRRCDHVIEWGGRQIRHIHQGFTKARIRAGLPDGVTPHTLRHTVATWATEAGVPMEQISQFLGHRDSRTTEAVYSHPGADYSAETAEAVRLNWTEA